MLTTALKSQQLQLYFMWAYFLVYRSSHDRTGQLSGNHTWQSFNHQIVKLCVLTVLTQTAILLSPVPYLQHLINMQKQISCFHCALKFQRTDKESQTHKSLQTLKPMKLSHMCTWTFKNSHGTTIYNNRKQEAINITTNIVKDLKKR